MKTLLALQKLDLRIESLRAREKEIPLQKEKFAIHRKRLAAELQESEDRCKGLQVEQREHEGDIDQKKEQIARYDGQLLGVKKNEEYQALLHEMDALRKQISLKEERIIAIMLEIDEAKDHLEEDKKRIGTEQEKIDSECGKIDQELSEAVAERKGVEAERAPLLGAIDRELLSRYARIRKALKTGPAVVPLRGETCSGCHMSVTPQAVNEILGGEKVHSCRHCGRLLFSSTNFEDEPAEAAS